MKRSTDEVLGGRQMRWSTDEVVDRCGGKQTKLGKYFPVFPKLFQLAKASNIFAGQ